MGKSALLDKQQDFPKVGGSKYSTCNKDQGNTKARVFQKNKRSEFSLLLSPTKVVLLGKTRKMSYGTSLYAKINFFIYSRTIFRAGGVVCHGPKIVKKKF